MFDELLKAAKELNGKQVQISSGVVRDAEGYIDRQCPAEICEFVFKVHVDDWRDKVRDEEVFCPLCGHAALSKSWFTHEQVEFQRHQALTLVKQHIRGAMQRDVEAWNRSQPRNRFVNITLKMGTGTKLVELPAPVTDPMRMQITCVECACRYAVIGSAFFCPSCGHNSAEQMFQQSINGIRSTLDALPSISRFTADADIAQTMARAVVENGLQNAVTAFQRYAESLLQRHPSPPKVRRNVFQSLTEGSAIWGAVFGSGYSAYLSQSELKLLQTFFQQRHVLAHCQGIVDDDYIQKSGDDTYRMGQRLVVKESTARQAVDLIEKLCRGLESDVQRSA